jgi:ribosomal protein S27E
MNPFAVMAVVMGTLLGLKRRCPKCKRAQVVPKSKKHQPVRCKFCGSDMPPEKGRGRTPTDY